MPFAEFITANTYVFFAAFTRVGVIMSVIPGFGDQSLPPMTRLAGALAVTVTLTPFAGEFYPHAPETPLVLAGLLAGEVAIGLVLGVTARLVMSAVNVAGQIISMQSSLAMAQSFDPSQQAQGALIGSFLSMAAITVIFVSDTHHLLLTAIRDSYLIFAPGAAPAAADAAELAIQTVSGAFRLGVSLAAPFIVFGVVFYFGIGLMSRMMPQVQVFFVAMPANVLLGFGILMLTVGSLLTFFLDHFEGVVSKFLS
ncbi:MAG: flagellar biosynthetic protein FliR [Pseudomonadota bacterium]